MLPTAKPAVPAPPVARTGSWRPRPGKIGAAGVVLAEKRVPIAGEADLVEARKAMRELAANVGFEDSGCVLLTLVASELARNIVQCARRGELVVRAIASSRGEAIEVVANEEPAEPTPALPSAPALGIGMVGVERLMDEFETASQEDGGRKIRARKWLPSLVGRTAQRSAAARERAAIKLRGPMEGDRLAEEYASALHEFMGSPSERALARVYSVARNAMGQGLGLLDVAAMHRQALDGAPRPPGPFGDEAVVALHLAHDLFAEALAPFELTRRKNRRESLVEPAAARATRTMSGAPAHDRVENELQRVAQSLHDEVQQQLALVSVSLDDLRRSAPSAFAPRIEHTLRQIDEVAGRVRRLSHELLPVAEADEKVSSN